MGRIKEVKGRQQIRQKGDKSTSQMQSALDVLSIVIIACTLGHFGDSSGLITSL